MQATERISLRATPHAKAMIEQASQLMGVSVSHFILSTMYEKSLNLVNTAQKHTWQPDETDSKKLMMLLENDRKSNDELISLLSLSNNIKDNTNA